MIALILYTRLLCLPSFYLIGIGNFTMDSCEVSNGSNRGIYFRNPYYYYDHYDTLCSVKNSNFTRMLQPFYIESSTVEVAFSRFYNNACSNDYCAAALFIVARRAFSFYANLVKGNSAHQILSVEKGYYGGNNFEVCAIDNLHNTHKYLLLISFLHQRLISLVTPSKTILCLRQRQDPMRLYC